MSSTVETITPIQAERSEKFEAFDIVFSDPTTGKVYAVEVAPRELINFQAVALRVLEVCALVFIVTGDWRAIVSSALSKNSLDLDTSISSL